MIELEVIFSSPVDCSCGNCLRSARSLVILRLLVKSMDFSEVYHVFFNDRVFLYSDVLKAKRRYETGLEKLQSAQSQVPSVHYFGLLFEI